MHLSQKSWNRLFGTCIAAFVIVGGGGYVGPSLGDAYYTGPHEGHTPEESMQKCHEEYPDRPEIWPGCQEFKIQKYQGTTAFHNWLEKRSLAVLFGLVTPALVISGRRWYLGYPPKPVEPDPN